VQRRVQHQLSTCQECGPSFNLPEASTNIPHITERTEIGMTTYRTMYSLKRTFSLIEKMVLEQS